MSYLRHPPLAVWTAITVGLAALIALAVHLGGGHPAGTGPLQAAPAVPASASAVRVDVATLRTLMAAGTAAGVDVPALHSFGTRAHTVAAAAVTTRRAEGAADGDPLLSTLTSAAADAGTVAGAGDVTTAVAGRSALALDVDTAAALVAGLPMPVGGVPAAHPLPTGQLSVPQVQPPTVPNLPALPSRPAAAPLPALGRN